jgi:hypothetical protein
VPDSQGWVLVLVIVIGLLVVARGFVAPIIIRRRRAGRLTQRQAGWLYGLMFAAPYVLLLLMVAISAPDGLPVILLLMALTLPVWVIAWVAIYRASGDPR